MKFIRESITIGLAQRSKAGIKVRQPLAKVTIYDDKGILNNDSELNSLITDELNLKDVEILNSVNKDNSELRVVIDTAISDDLRKEGLVREVIRFVQNARKQAGLNVEDRIELRLLTEEKTLTVAISDYADLIKTETLAIKLVGDDLKGDIYSTEVTVDSIPLRVVLINAEAA